MDGEIETPNEEDRKIIQELVESLGKMSDATSLYHMTAALSAFLGWCIAREEDWEAAWRIMCNGLMLNAKEYLNDKEKN